LETIIVSRWIISSAVMLRMKLLPIIAAKRKPKIAECEAIPQLMIWGWIAKTLSVDFFKENDKLLV